VDGENVLRTEHTITLSASPSSGCTTKCPRHLPAPATPFKPPPCRPWGRLF